MVPSINFILLGFTFVYSAYVHEGNITPRGATHIFPFLLSPSNPLSFFFPSSLPSPNFVSPRIKKKKKISKNLISLKGLMCPKIGKRNPRRCFLFSFSPPSFPLFSPLFLTSFFIDLLGKQDWLSLPWESY